MASTAIVWEVPESLYEELVKAQYALNSCLA